MACSKTKMKYEYILVAVSLALLVWLLLPKELTCVTNFYYTLRLRIDKVNFPIENVMGRSGGFVDPRTFSPGVVTNNSRYAVPWHTDQFIFTNSPRYQNFTKGNWNNTSVDHSKTLFYNLLKDFFFYKPVISTDKRQELMDTITVFAQACDQANIGYFLCGDTLLGLYRHQGLVPWTGNAHICMDEADWVNISFWLSRIPHFHLEVFRNKPWKFYPDKYSKNQSGRFPFLDISFYRRDSSHIWSLAPSSMPGFVYRIQDISPLYYKPFEGIRLPVPNNTEQILMDYYGDVERNCRSDNDNVLMYVSSNVKTFVNLPCEFLHDIYPFVFRENHNGYQLEILKVGRKVLSTNRFIRMEVKGAS